MSGKNALHDIHGMQSNLAVVAAYIIQLEKENAHLKDEISRVKRDAVEILEGKMGDKPDRLSWTINNNAKLRIRIADLESELSRVKQKKEPCEWRRIGYDGMRDELHYSSCKGYTVIRKKDSMIFKFCPFCGKEITGMNIRCEKIKAL